MNTFDVGYCPHSMGSPSRWAGPLLFAGNYDVATAQFLNLAVMRNHAGEHVDAYEECAQVVGVF